jgi:hypothetical protein
MERKKTCEKCGTTVHKTFAFCPKCGTALAEQFAERYLDGVPIRTDKTGEFCDINCPLMQYDQGTVCGLERHKNWRSRYDSDTDGYRRCPECKRRERKE